VVFAEQKPPFQLHYFVFMVLLIVNLKKNIMFGFKALQELADAFHGEHQKQILKKKKEKNTSKKDVHKKHKQFTTADVIGIAQEMGVNLF
jgi:uncharacterized membrane protein YkgB